MRTLPPLSITNITPAIADESTEKALAVPASPLALPPSEEGNTGITDVYSPPALAATSKGVLAHATHFADLMLDVVPGTDDGTIPAARQYTAFARRFVGEIEKGRLSRLNEKIDGSPALLIGLDAAGSPFVAYKLGLAKKGGARLVRVPADAGIHFHNHDLAQIFSDAITLLGPGLKRFGESGIIFQADLLYTPHNGARSQSPQKVKIRANPSGIEYVLDRKSPLFAAVRESQIGLVVHTAMRPTIDPETGNITGTTDLDDDEAIKRVTAALTCKDVLALDPWAENIAIDTDPQTRMDTPKKGRILDLLQELEESHAALSPDFRRAWNDSKLALPFAQYLNSGLKPGAKGGIYQAARAGELFDFDKLMRGFRAWLMLRADFMLIDPEGKKTSLGPKNYPTRLDGLLRDHGADMQRFCASYYNGIVVHYLLQAHLKQAFCSKLGGGPIEGFMLKDEESGVRVKFVDRLHFTMLNFSGESARKIKRRPKSGDAPPVPSPLPPDPALAEMLGPWRDGLVFWPAKAQPPHRGHAALLARAALEFGAENLFVLPSLRAPNLDGNSYDTLRATDKRSELEAGLYTYAFSLALRREMLEHLLPEGSRAVFADHRALWSLIKNARDEGLRGQVVLLVGEKERRAGRYAKQLEGFGSHVRLHALSMQHEGVSATLVRWHIKNLVENGSRESYGFLVQAFSYINDPKLRDRFIGRLIAEWKSVHAAAKRILG